MRKFLLLLFLWLLISFTSIYAQQQRIDSLKNDLQYEKIVQFVDELQTEDENLLLEKAQALQKIGNINEAIYCLEEVGGGSQNVEIFRQLANFYNRIGNKQQALTTLQKALLIKKSNVLYYEIAKLQYKLRYFEAGKETCNQLLQKDTLANVLRLQSLFYSASGEKEEGTRLLERAIILNPKDYLSVERLATFYKAEQDYDKACAITDAYLQLDSTNVNILELNAYAYFSLKKFRKAKKQYEKLMELGCKSGENYFYMGYTYYRLGQANDAYNSLYMANELAQGLNEAILYYLGLAAIKSLRYEQAIGFLEKALHYYLPDNEKIEDIYARQSHAYHSLGQNVKAVEMLKKGMRYNYEHRTLYHIAYLYDTSKHEKQAEKAYKKFLKALPDSLKDKSLIGLKKYTELRLQQIQEKKFMNRDSVSLAK